MKRLGLAISFIATLTMEAQAQTTQDASRRIDLRPLVGAVSGACFFAGKPYESFRQSLVESLSSDVKGKIRVAAPPEIQSALGTPVVRNLGDYTDFVVPVINGHLNGLVVTRIIVAAGTDNGISIDGLEFEASKLEVDTRFKGDLAKSKSAIKNGKWDIAPPSFKVVVRGRRSQIVCDSST